ncbi:MAG: 3-phosphoshikimate 1-carboxyvinyltransferase, partial [Verrucomicrobia bacterium]|nr:3-phosphoshikimate 1-carboxyvinyltransferase [Verrucomicrobiota bacterium]
MSSGYPATVVTTVVLQPNAGPLDAVVPVPGSKSVANRALVCAMLSKDASRITGLPSGDDARVVLDVIKDSGRSITNLGNEVIIGETSTLKFPGIVDAVLAGTSSRFLTAVAALFDTTSIIDGEEVLRSRPMADLHTALESLGAEVLHLGEVGHLPVSVSRGALTGGDIRIAGNVSSQFISALMLIGPMLDEGLVIHVDGPLVSRSYVEMTAHVMKSFGASVTLDDSTITVSSGAYRGREYVIEPDYSSAAFPLVAVSVREGSVVIPGLATSSLQGDAEILPILKTMGLTCVISGGDVSVSRSRSQTVLPLVMDMSDCSDLVPAVAVACCMAIGESVLSGIGFIRNKESDRLGDLANELNRAGA